MGDDYYRFSGASRRLQNLIAALHDEAGGKAHEPFVAWHAKIV
jgi:hypothetical protein